uniref:RNA-directed DNA polymerase n=1 Tax=Strongyloides papillosus TaxID=174720 RepID=A0A0N5B3J0_STREA
MTYQYTLAVNPYSHLDKGKRFSTFLTQLKDTMTIDCIVDQDIKFPLLRSRLADHTMEIIPDVLPDETFEQYTTRLSTIFDDNHLTANLETQYSFYKLNFTSDKFEDSLREFHRLHEMMYKNLPTDVNFKAFRRKLLDLLTSRKDLFMTALKSTATTNQTILLELLQFHSANQLLTRNNKPRDICSWCSIPGHKESECRRKSNGFAKGNYHFLKNNKKDSPSITPSLKKEMNNSKKKDDVIHPLIIKEVKVNNHPMRALIDPGSNITCISPDVRDIIIPPNSPETFHQISSNGHRHFATSTLCPVTIQIEDHSYTLENIYINPVPYENYNILIGMDYLKPMGAIIHTSDGSIDFETTPETIQKKNHSYTLGNIFINPLPYENYNILIGMDYLKPIGAIIHTSDGSIDFETTPETIQVNNAKLGSIITEVEFERKIKHDIQNNFPSLSPSNEYDVGPGKLTAPEQIIFPTQDIPDFKYYHTPQTPELKSIINNLYENGIIEYSDAIETCPYYLLTKRLPDGQQQLNDDGSPRRRFVLDARRINAATHKIVQQSPHLTTIIGSMYPFKHATKLDLTNSFFQITLHPNNRHHFSFTAFSKTYQFCRLVQGAKNSSSIFQRSIEKIIPSIKDAQIFVYIDDLLILTNSTPQSHYDAVMSVITCLHSYGLKINISKCEFYRESITYLGWTFKGETFGPAADSVSSLLKKSRPRTKKQLYARLQSINYFRMMSPLFTKYSRNLHSIATNKSSNQTIEWTSALIDDYNKLIDCVFATPLHLPPKDQPYILKIKVDACQTGIGSSLIYVLSSTDIPKPIAHYSYKLPESKYGRSPTYLELLGIKKSLDFFHYFIINADSTIIVESDHKPLQYIHKSNEKHLLDLIQCICAYDIKITYINQSSNELADCISRLFTNSVQLKKRGRPRKIQFDHGKNMDEFDSMDIHVLQLQNSDNSILDALENNTPWEGTFLKRRGDDVIATTQHQIAIPENLETINKILYLAHDKSGHYGIDRTLQFITNSVFIPHIRKYVVNYINNCTICQSTNSAPSLLPDKESNYTYFHPWENVSCDILGPLEETSRLNKHIILFVDIITKYLIAKPIMNTQSATIEKIILQVIQVHGPMKVLRMDNAPYFKGIVKFLESYGISPSFSTPLNSTGNTFAERHIQSLQNTLTKELLVQKDKEWDQLTDLVAYYHNISSKPDVPSPFELHFSRLSISPLSMRLKTTSYLGKEMVNVNHSPTTYYKKKLTRKLQPKYSVPCSLKSISKDGNQLPDIQQISDSQLLKYSDILNKKPKDQLQILKLCITRDIALRISPISISPIFSPHRSSFQFDSEQTLNLSISDVEARELIHNFSQTFPSPSHSSVSSQEILYSANSSPTQPLLAIEYKQKKMTYQYTLAVNPYSHLDKGRRFSTFLTQLDDAMTIDGIVDQDIKFPLLRSRLADHTMEIIPDVLPDETFEQYTTRLSTIFDDNHLTANLETQYSFYKLNFTSDKFEDSLREFHRLHEMMYKSLPTDVNFKAFRRKLLDLLTSRKDLFMTALKSTATTNQTILLELLQFHSANQLLTRNNKPRNICSWCSIPGHKESECRRKSNGFAKGNYHILKNNKKDSPSITPSLKKEMNNSKKKRRCNTSSYHKRSKGSNTTCISLDVRDIIIPPNSPKTFHQISSNGHRYFATSTLCLVTIQIENHSYTLENIYINPLPYENYNILIGMDYLKPIGAIIHTSDGSIDFESTPDTIQVNIAKLGSIITEVEFERKIKHDIQNNFPSLSPSNEYDVGPGKLTAPEQIIFPTQDIPDFKYYHTPQTPELKSIINNLYENGITEYSDAIETRPYYLLTKRLSDGQQQLNDDGSPRRRFVLDACRINAATHKIVQQSPHLTTIIGSMYPFKHATKNLHSIATNKSSNQTVEWTSALIDDYNKLIDCVFATPLHLPPKDQSYILKIKVDACQTGIGSSLIYVVSSTDIPKPIAHYSDKLPESKYGRSPTYIELLGIKKSLDFFHYFIINANSTIIIESDHKTLQYIHKSNEKHLLDLIQCICGYNIKIIYVNQSSNELADCISRLFTNSIQLKKRGRPRKIQFYHGKNMDEFDSMDIHALQLQNSDNSILDALKNNTPWEGTFLQRRGDDVIVTTQHQIVIPENLETINKILYLAHDKSGHYGIDRTLQFITNSAFIPHIRKYVINYISNCTICQSANSAPSLLPDKESIYIYFYPWENVSFDILGPLEKTSRLNKHISLFVDIITKYLITKPIINTQSATIKKIILPVIQVHEPMKVLRMDNVPYFKGIVKFLESYGIFPSFSTPLNSTVNTFAERHI